MSRPSKITLLTLAFVLTIFALGKAYFILTNQQKTRRFTSNHFILPDGTSVKSGYIVQHDDESYSLIATLLKATTDGTSVSIDVSLSNKAGKKFNRKMDVAPLNPESGEFFLNTQSTNFYYSASDQVTTEIYSSSVKMVKRLNSLKGKVVRLVLITKLPPSLNTNQIPPKAIADIIRYADCNRQLGTSLLKNTSEILCPPQTNSISVYAP